jgi:HD-like signal output (HDOD) protein/ActR/RegA family two-component response regulator
MSERNSGKEIGAQVDLPHQGRHITVESMFGDTSSADALAFPTATPGGTDRRYRVMFVDDEENMLAGLRRMLRSAQDSWDMVFASSGAEALEILSHSPVDAVVSDMRMPVMNGAEFLARVQDLHPSTARLVLSGQSDPDTVLDVVRSAQQFLTKPCDSQTLMSSIWRALSVQQSLTDPILRELIGGVSALPTLPSVYDQLVEAVTSENVELSEIAAIVTSDIGTSAELLKLVNSAFFGLPREVYSVEDAVLLLGLDNVQALVLTSSLFRVNQGLSWILDVEELRAQALRRAAIARAIARHEEMTARARDTAVLSCMLRDVGTLVLTEGRPEAAGQLHTAIAAEPEPPSPPRLCELEIGAYGCSVPQVSAYLLGLWGFAPAIVHTIAAQPLTETQQGVNAFEWLLSFAHNRAIAPGEHATSFMNDYLTSDRLRAWNLAADDVISRELDHSGVRGDMATS